MYILAEKDLHYNEKKYHIKDLLTSPFNYNTSPFSYNRTCCVITEKDSVSNEILLLISRITNERTNKFFYFKKDEENLLSILFGIYLSTSEKVVVSPTTKKMFDKWKEDGLFTGAYKQMLIDVSTKSPFELELNNMPVVKNPTSGMVAERTVPLAPVSEAAKPVSLEETVKPTSPVEKVEEKEPSLEEKVAEVPQKKRRGRPRKTEETVKPTSPVEKLEIIRAAIKEKGLEEQLSGKEEQIYTAIMNSCEKMITLPLQLDILLTKEVSIFADELFRSGKLYEQIKG